jgi:hypothetical protein
MKGDDSFRFLRQRVSCLEDRSTSFITVLSKLLFTCKYTSALAAHTYSLSQGIMHSPCRIWNLNHPINAQIETVILQNGWLPTLAEHTGRFLMLASYQELFHHRHEPNSLLGRLQVTNLQNAMAQHPELFHQQHPLRSVAFEWSREFQHSRRLQVHNFDRVLRLLPSWTNIRTL